MKTKIRYIRQEAGISQGDLAKKVNVSRQTISALENGRYNPSLVLAYKITKVLGCPHIEDLFLFDEGDLWGNKVDHLLRWKLTKKFKSKYLNTK